MLRTTRYPYRGEHVPGLDVDAYEKLDVEECYLAASAVVLRLPMVFGERDPQRREEFVLRRVRVGRAQIPFGAGTLLWSRGWVRDIAAAVVLAAETDLAGEVLGRLRVTNLDSRAVGPGDPGGRGQRRTTRPRPRRPTAR